LQACKLVDEDPLNIATDLWPFYYNIFTSMPVEYSE